MCWNATASLTALILGTVLSLVTALVAMKQKKWSVVVLSLGWLWVIGMQYWEYLLWTSPVSSDANAFASRWAYIFNVTQVLVLGLLFLAFADSHLGVWNKVSAVVILLVYACYIMYYAPDMTTLRTTKASCEEPHLHYPWWDQMPYGGAIYLMALILLFLLIVRPLAWSVGTITLIMSLFAMSMTFYSSSVASMWCFFAVFVPVASLLFA